MFKSTTDEDEQGIITQDIFCMQLGQLLLINLQRAAHSWASSFLTYGVVITHVQTRTDTYTVDCDQSDRNVYYRVINEK